MELKVVYRALRKISDWTVNGYYSEVYVEGQENIPKKGPLVLTPTHHNEIIDIAALCRFCQFLCYKNLLMIPSSNNHSSWKTYILLGQVVHVQKPDSGSNSFELRCDSCEAQSEQSWSWYVQKPSRGRGLYKDKDWPRRFVLPYVGCSWTRGGCGRISRGYELYSTRYRASSARCWLGGCRVSKVGAGAISCWET